LFAMWNHKLSAAMAVLVVIACCACHGAAESPKLLKPNPDPVPEPTCPRYRYVFPDNELDCLKPGCTLEDIAGRNVIIVSNRNLRRAPLTTMHKFDFSGRNIIFPVPSYQISQPCPIGEFYIPLDVEFLDFFMIEADGNDSTLEYVLRFRIMPWQYETIRNWERDHYTPIEDEDRVWIDREIFMLLYADARTLDFYNAFVLPRGLDSNVASEFPEMFVADFDNDGVDEIATTFSDGDLHILSIRDRSGYVYQQVARCGVVVPAGESNPHNYGFQYDPEDRRFTCYGPDHEGGRASRTYIGYD